MRRALHAFLVFLILMVPTSAIAEVSGYSATAGVSVDGVRGVWLASIPVTAPVTFSVVEVEAVDFTSNLFGQSVHMRVCAILCAEGINRVRLELPFALLAGNEVTVSISTVRTQDARFAIATWGALQVSFDGSPRVAINPYAGLSYDIENPRTIPGSSGSASSYCRSGYACPGAAQIPPGVRNFTVVAYDDAFATPWIEACVIFVREGPLDCNGPSGGVGGFGRIRFRSADVLPAYSWMNLDAFGYKSDRYGTKGYLVTTFD